MTLEKTSIILIEAGGVSGSGDAAVFWRKRHMDTLLEKARQYEKNALEKEKQSGIPRPAVHFTNPVGWMNDPNGFSDYKGEHHLFFQYYPYDTRWDSMHWGHAKSSDFIRWEYLPAAMAPDQPYDELGVFSGSALVRDEKQVLIYTGVKNVDGEGYQTQCLAVGDGLNYEKAPENPVIPASLLPAGYDRKDFRDPKIWKDGDVYYVVVGCRSEENGGEAALFSSTDLKNWKFETILDKSFGKLGIMWECPDFFPVGEKWALTVSPIRMEAEGLEFHPGNNCIVLTGTYDPETMKFQRETVRSLDYGLDFYAPQTMETADGRRVIIGWMQSCEKAFLPEGFPWCGIMSIPRELFMENGRLCQRPVRELEAYLKEKAVYTDISVKEKQALSGIRGRMIELAITLKGTDYDSWTLSLAAGEKHDTTVTYDRKHKILTFDRTHSGVHWNLVHSRSMYVTGKEEELSLRILLDRYTVEIFADGGAEVFSALLYTEVESDGIFFESDGEALMDVTAREIVLEEK